jgi:hypothetical protein
VKPADIEHQILQVWLVHFVWTDEEGQEWGRSMTMYSEPDEHDIEMSKQFVHDDWIRLEKE